MSSFEWTCGPVWCRMVVVANTALVRLDLQRPDGTQRHRVAGAEATASTGSAQQGAAAGPEPIGPLLANADPKRGEQIAKVCVQCHSFNKGGPNKIGPNLWDVTEEPMASVSGYQFSAAMAAHKGEKWDPEKLNEWLWKPQALMKGTKMTFAGLPKTQDRADVIAYLESLK